MIYLWRLAWNQMDRRIHPAIPPSSLVPENIDAADNSEGGRTRSHPACSIPGRDGMGGATRVCLEGTGPPWVLPPSGGPTPHWPTEIFFYQVQLGHTQPAHSTLTPHAHTEFSGNNLSTGEKLVWSMVFILFTFVKQVVVFRNTC